MSELENIIYSKTSIPTEFEVLLDSIKIVEGGILHYNNKETDITNGYGVYRAIHSDNIVFKYIDSVAKDITGLKSSSWKDKVLLNMIDNVIDKDIDRYLSYLFYKEYLKNAKLYLFDSSLSVMLAGLYSNSPVGMWKSVQESLLDMVKDDILPLSIKDLSLPDGVFGSKTENALLILKNLETSTKKEKELVIKLFKKSILLSMKSYYINIIDDNPDKYVKNILGWNNRVEELEHT